VGDGARYLEGVRRLARGASPARGDGVVVEDEALHPATRVREAWMLGLRLAEGLDLARTAARIGVDPRVGHEATIERLAQEGDLARDGDRVRVPRSRWLVLDRIVRDFM
jgi:oxygen-independent coproporphyrinogen-3 oxidase